MTVEAKLSYDLAYLRQYSESHKEPEWLFNIRQQAYSKIEELSLPKPDKTKIDNWNFTEFKHSTETIACRPLEELAEEVKALIDLTDKEKNIIVQENGNAIYRQAASALKEKGVIFTDIYTALQEHGDLVKKYYMTNAVNVDEHRLTALHAAFMNGGTFIYVPKDVVIEEPLHVIYVQNEENIALFNHVIIVAEDNSKVTYVENYLSFHEQQSVANIVSEVIAKPNAHIVYGAVDHFAKGMTAYINRRGVAGNNAKIQWALGQMNDGDTISNNHTMLVGDGSFADTKSVVVGRGEQTQNFTTNITHFGRHSEGNILQHGVMKDQASAIFNGIGKIEHGATKADAQQTSRVLMLSDKARGDANPILLIDEDDVTAGHAASVGRVNPMELYYLMSRGISKKDAERLIIRGFLAPVVKELAIEEVQKQLEEVIERKVK